MEERANAELACWVDITKAQRVVYERELIYQYAKDSDGPASAALELLKVYQGSNASRDDDAFRRDELTRLIELMPPSRDDLRLSDGVFR